MEQHSVTRFAQAEAQFELQRIIVDDTKYSYQRCGLESRGADGIFELGGTKLSANGFNSLSYFCVIWALTSAQVVTFVIAYGPMVCTEKGQVDLALYMSLSCQLPFHLCRLLSLLVLSLLLLSVFLLSLLPHAVSFLTDKGLPHCHQELPAGQEDNVDILNLIISLNSCLLVCLEKHTTTIHHSYYNIVFFSTLFGRLLLRVLVAHTQKGTKTAARSGD